MKTIALLCLPFLLGGSLNAPKAGFQGKAYDESEKLDFTDSTQQEVDSYYADVDTGKTGAEFIQTLYDVISIDNTFVSYDDVTDWYKITDRNWELSQEIDPDTYTFSKDQDGNYFLVQVYSSGNDDSRKAYNTDANGNKWKKDDSLDHIDWDSQTKNNSNIQIDKEHVWAKSHGFAPGDEDPSLGAGTDLHHLMAADHYTNSSGHNNLDFGIVADHGSAKVIRSYNADGTSDVSGYRGKNAEGVEVFEPMDEWKGDIARALFYMATRYSHDGNNSKEEPYLIITDDWTMADENDRYMGVQHGLTTFLEWNREDPVSPYEKKRNDLIYKNVQNNRNPFVDHPEWVDQAFDSEFENLPSLDGLQESYNLYVGHPAQTGVTIPESGQGYDLKVTSSDPSVADVDSDMKTLLPKKAGETTITYTLSVEGSDSVVKSTLVHVKDLPSVSSTTGIDLSKGIDLSFLQTVDLGLTLDGGYGEKIVLTCSDESVVAIDGETVRARGFGTCTIEAAIESNGEKIVLARIPVTVKITWPVILIAAIVVIVLLVILILIVRHNQKKKKKRKSSSRKGKKRD